MSNENKIVLSSSEFALTTEELLEIETDLKLEKKRKIFVCILDKCIDKLVSINDDESEILVRFEADKSPSVTIKGTPNVRWGFEAEKTDLKITKAIFYTYSGKRNDLLKFLYNYRDTVLNYGKNITFHTEVAE